MLANFFFKRYHFKHKIVVWIFFIVISQLYHSQKASYIENITESEGLPSNYVFNANEDQNGTIWLGTDKGLVTYLDGKWKSLDADSGMPGNYINRVVADGNRGLLMYLSEKGLYYFDTNTRKILCNYPQVKDKIILNLRKSPYNKNYLIIHFLDNNSKQEKFFGINIKEIKKLIPLQVEIGQIFIKSNNNKEKLADVTFFESPEKIKYHDFNLEITKNGVLRTLNGKVIDTLTQKNGLNNNFISHIFKTKNDNVIISTIGGGISILRDNNAKTSFINRNINTRNISTNQRKKYLLSDGYLYIINKDKLETKIFLKKDALTFLVDGSKFYLGSFSGLDTYSLVNNRLKLINTYPITVGISKIEKEDDKIIFTTYGRGIFVKQGNVVKNYTNRPFNNIENFYKIKNGYAMISYESGISLLDKNFNFLQHIDKKDGLNSNFATYTFSDNDTIYVGTKKGVTSFYHNKILYNYNKDNGYTGNITKSIFRDKKNRIWVLTDKNLQLKFKNTLKPFGSLKILENKEDIILKGEYSAEDNFLAIATKNKISEINLDKIVPNRFVRPTFLVKILENDKVINHHKNLYFEDHNKNIQFIFSSVDKDILGSTKLFYKVNDEPWKPFKEPRALKFSHLDQGEYKIQIKSVNEDGYEIVMPEKINFKVLGPFFIRWWFLLSFFSIVGFFLYNYINEMNKKKYIKRLNQLRVKHQLENERKRISRELHDNIGAYVTSLISKIDKLKNVNQYIASKGEVSCDDVRLDAEHILALLRQTIWVLGNKETNLIALYDNFKSYAQKFLQTDEIKIIFEENIENNRNFDSTTGSGIFRIMQEALQNIYKHAHANKVEVNVTSTDKIIIYLKDNGKGFDQEKLREGFGLKNMRERARELGFKFNIYSDSSGTTLELYEI